MSTHKDWDGPGIYDVWSENNGWGNEQIKRRNGQLSYYHTYRKTENFTQPEPPKKPEKKLCDGLYHIEDEDGDPRIYCIKSGVWHDNRGVRCQSFGSHPPTKIIGRVCVCPLESEE